MLYPVDKRKDRFAPLCREAEAGSAQPLHLSEKHKTWQAQGFVGVAKTLASGTCVVFFGRGPTFFLVIGLAEVKKKTPLQFELRTMVFMMWIWTKRVPAAPPSHLSNPHVAATERVSPTITRGFTGFIFKSRNAHNCVVFPTSCNSLFDVFIICFYSQHSNGFRWSGCSSDESSGCFCANFWLQLGAKFIKSVSKE